MPRNNASWLFQKFNLYLNIFSGFGAKLTPKREAISLGN